MQFARDAVWPGIKCTLYPALEQKAGLGKIKYFLPGVLLLNYLFITPSAKNTTNCGYIGGFPLPLALTGFLQ